MPQFHRDPFQALTSPRRQRLRCDRLLVVLLLPVAALAQSTGGPYVMRKQVIASAAQAQGGVYAMTGTVHQPIASVQAAGPYRLTGGFHGGSTSADRLFCDGFEGTPCD